MKFENTNVYNIEQALMSMRNAMSSCDKSDSVEEKIGEKDKKLAQKLIKAGSEHRKFLRQIFVSVDITAPAYWWAEFDTYKVGVTRSSTSFMHTGLKEKFTTDDFDFTFDVQRYGFLWNVIDVLNELRERYLATGDDVYFRQIRQLLPQSYLYTSTVSMNYEVILNMVHQRKNHKLQEWNTNFIDWVKTLPQAKIFLLF